MALKIIQNSSYISFLCGGDFSYLREQLTNGAVSYDIQRELVGFLDCKIFVNKFGSKHFQDVFNRKCIHYFELDEPSIYFSDEEYYFENKRLKDLYKKFYHIFLSSSISSSIQSDLIKSRNIHAEDFIGVLCRSQYINSTIQEELYEILDEMTRNARVSFVNNRVLVPDI